MDPLAKARIGRTDLHVTRLGLGARGIVDPAVAAMADYPIPSEMWADLRRDGLIRQGAPAP